MIQWIIFIYSFIYQRNNWLFIFIICEMPITDTFFIMSCHILSGLPLSLFSLSFSLSVYLSFCDEDKWGVKQDEACCHRKIYSIHVSIDMKCLFQLKSCFLITACPEVFYITYSIQNISLTLSRVRFNSAVHTFYRSCVISSTSSTNPLMFFFQRFLKGFLIGTSRTIIWDDQ